MWTIATALGIRAGGIRQDNLYRLIWRSRDSAQAWADHLNHGTFGQHYFAVPLPGAWR